MYSPAEVQEIRYMQCIRQICLQPYANNGMCINTSPHGRTVHIDHIY